MIKNPGYQPVNNETLVIAKFACGGTNEPTRAEVYDWSLVGRDDDLIEYKIYEVKND